MRHYASLSVADLLVMYMADANTEHGERSRSFSSPAFDRPRRLLVVSLHWQRLLLFPPSDRYLSLLLHSDNMGACL